MSTKKSRVDQLIEACAEKGVVLDTYSPGDGVTRYRFGSISDQWVNDDGTPVQVDYFSMRPDYTALGWKEAVTYAAGRGVFV